MFDKVTCSNHAILIESYIAWCFGRMPEGVHSFFSHSEEHISVRAVWSQRPNCSLYRHPLVLNRQVSSDESQRGRQAHALELHPAPIPERYRLLQRHFPVQRNEEKASYHGCRRLA